MNVVFLGTPDFATLTLDALIVSEHIELAAVITQPDRQAGRGKKMQAPPVKLLAQKHNIPVFQPVKLSKSPDVVEQIKNLAPDLIVMVAFGQILKPQFIAIPKMGVINLHASLLPAYRGAAPLNWAIINGETMSGITTMFTEAGLDTGPMLLKEEIVIPPDMNAEQLAKEMATKGAALVIKTIEELRENRLIPTPQDDSMATYAPMLDKNLANISWDKPATTIHNLIRGLIPWPVAYTFFHSQPLKIWRSQLVNNSEKEELTHDFAAVEPGTIVLLYKRLFVACADRKWLELLEVQPANKSKVNAFDWANGIRLQSGDRF